jgi:transposase
MKTWKFILGVDVSKLTLDIHSAERSTHLKIHNGASGFKLLQKWCKDEEINLKQCLVVM